MAKEEKMCLNQNFQYVLPVRTFWNDRYLQSVKIPRVTKKTQHKQLAIHIFPSFKGLSSVLFSKKIEVGYSCIFNTRPTHTSKFDYTELHHLPWYFGWVSRQFDLHHHSHGHWVLILLQQNKVQWTKKKDVFGCKAEAMGVGE